MDSSTLAASLRLELEAFAHFYELLQTEREALANTDVNSLVEIAQRKSDKVLQLTQLADKRNLAIKSAMPTSMLANLMEAWLVKNDPNGISEVGQLWHELLVLAKQAKDLNQSNGAMIQLSLRHNRQALETLHAAAQQTSLYGADGQTHWLGSGRQLGQV